MAVSRSKQWWGLAGFVALAMAVAALGSLFTSSGMGSWYAALEKPSFNPPSWVFGPVWTTLYVMMAVAAWLVWKRAGAGAAGMALGAWLVQLALNLTWSGIFFGLRAPGWAFAEIIVLWIAILLTTALFFRHSRVAGWLLVPYMAWVTFAAVLNFAIMRMN